MLNIITVSHNFSKKNSFNWKNYCKKYNIDVLDTNNYSSISSSSSSKEISIPQLGQ